MTRKKAEKKRTPQRICIACREIAGKRGLIRIVRTADGVEVDPSGKLPGRGAYVHSKADCWQHALEANRLSQSLRIKISAEQRQKLEDFLATLTN